MSRPAPNLSRITTPHGIRHLEDLLYIADHSAALFDGRVSRRDGRRIDDPDLQKLESLHAFEAIIEEARKVIERRKGEIGS